MSENEDKVTVGRAIKNTGKVAGKAAMTGVQMAAAYEFNCAAVDLMKMGLAEADVPKELLDVEAVDTILHFFTPLTLLMVTEKFPGMLPGDKYINAAAVKALEAESFQKLAPILAKIRPKLVELARKGKDVAAPSAGALGAKQDDIDFEVDIEDIEFENNKQKLNKDKMGVK